MPLGRPRVLDDVEPRILGLSLADQLASRSPSRVQIDLGRATMREAIWALPAIDAAARAFPGASLALSASATVKKLLAGHLPRAHGTPDSTPDFTIDLAPRRCAAARIEGTRLLVSRAPFPQRRQHASAHWIHGARAAGLAPNDGAPSLRLSRAARTAAQRRAATLRGALVAIVAAEGGARFVGLHAVGDLLVARLGATVIDPATVEDPAERAALLALCAVCVGDDCDFTHVAAAVGAPVVMIDGATSPTWSGPASRDGAAVWTTRCHCTPPIRKGARCLACLAPRRVAAVAERLAAARWPWDRLRRWAPL